MNYPLISEYAEAVKMAEENFDKLYYLRPVFGSDGKLVMASGNFSVVFKMIDVQTGKMHAVKCFLKDQEGLAVTYRQIAEELEFVNSSFLTPVRFLDKELFVDSHNSSDTEFPVLLMEWVEGKTLDKYIREHLTNPSTLALLANQFSRMAMWLMTQPFAHGDLKPDNILVREDGSLVLVDYDGMFVPAMKGQRARELGSPDFRHPGRTTEDFDEHIDDFPLISILLSIKAISLQPQLLEQYGASDRLLFSERDYRDFSKCEVIKEIFPSSNSDLNTLLGMFTIALAKNNLSDVSCQLILLDRQTNKSEQIDVSRSNLLDDNLHFIVRGVSFCMVHVEGGTFTMGATSEQGSDAYPSENPAHQVTLSTFSIGETEVTQELWEAVMGSNPSYFKGAKRPVEQVSWNDCQEFIRKLNALTGQTFRLPTEAEWEYAARGGNLSHGYKYAGSNNIDEVAWIGVNSGHMSHEVAKKQPNELGLYDMSGNVYEWCGDWFRLYSNTSQTNPMGASRGASRVYRGGSWYNSAGNCRTSNRHAYSPDNRIIYIGFRLALSY